MLEPPPTATPRTAGATALRGATARPGAPARLGAPTPGAETPGVPPATSGSREIGGPTGPEPTRYGDWEKNGRCIDF